MLAFTGCDGEVKPLKGMLKNYQQKISYAMWTSILICGRKTGKEFKNSGTYLNPIIDRRIRIFRWERLWNCATKSGSEAATLLKIILIWLYSL